MLDQDPFQDRVPGYALGTLDAAERESMAEHVECCAACQAELDAFDQVVARLPVPPRPAVREQLLDLADAPAGPVDPSAYDWVEVVPGVRFHVVKRDEARDVRSYLVWARPGARHPRHRHRGAEVILVLQGALSDGQRAFGTGEICRSVPGSVHYEEALPGEDCVCFVVSYGGVDIIDSAA